MRRITVLSRPEFENYYLTDNVAVISIEDVGGAHLLPGGPNVLNVDFDDVSDGPTAITDSQASEIVKFIERNQDKDFVIHCTAGKSRSQGVARFILDYYDYTGGPCVTPNIEVIIKLKRAYETILFYISDGRH